MDTWKLYYLVGSIAIIASIAVNNFVNSLFLLAYGSLSVVIGINSMMRNSHYERFLLDHNEKKFFGIKVRLDKIISLLSYNEVVKRSKGRSKGRT